MKFGENVFRNLYRLGKDFIYHYCAYVELKTNFKSLKGDTEFWVYTIDAHLQMAVIRWCMIFGSDSNETHWKQLNLDKTDYLERLCRELQMTQCEWSAYWDSMKNFRDHYVAHRWLDDIPSVPYLDRAVRALLCLEKWIREQLQNMLFEEENTNVCYFNGSLPFDKLMEQAKKDIRRSILSMVRTTNGTAE